jgi:(E)-4-hydroxy-3-methylbut-2-enyl-diphosphate synthase
MKERRPTRKIYIGKVAIGGGSPVTVQSMTKTDTRDVEATVRQIKGLETAGCEIIRLAVVDMDAAQALGRVRGRISIPMVADIHFDYRLALEAVGQGVDGLRLNPGNIGEAWKVREVVAAAKDRGIPVRIGVNAGSLEKDILARHGHPTPEAIVESAERHIRILEDLNFRDIKVSLKASNVMMTVDAYRLFSSRFDYPLHIGITETGPASTGAIKSAVGLGILLEEGIGDTMRVSLTAGPEEEVRVAYEILRAVGSRRRGAEIVSCPTCGRCEVDMRPIAEAVEKALRSVERPITVAVMGCVVNGPGEAGEADYGVACGRGSGIVFRHGEVVKTVGEDELLQALLDLINEEQPL